MIMKIEKLLWFLLIPFLLLGIVSCKDERPMLRVSETEIGCVFGEMVDISVSGGYGQYFVESDDPSIASAEINQDEHRMYIWGNKVGTTWLTVTDQMNDVVRIAVTVNGVVQDFTVMDFLYSVSVKNNDAKLRQEIKNELQSSVLFPQGTRYKLTYTTYDGGILQVYPKGTDESDVITGTFQVKEQWYLFRYDEKKVILSWSIYTGSIDAPIQNSYLLMEDLTRQYIERYTAEKINTVARAQVVRLNNPRY